MLARVPWVRPNSAVKPKPRKMNGDRKKRLVVETCIILKTGEPTHFAFEASCRHGLRSALCLEGWPWADAEKMAAEIVSAALMIIGARRPTWQQGQPEWTQACALPVERTHCKNCRTPLPEGTIKFCCRECQVFYNGRKRQEQRHSEFLARQAAENAA